LIKRTSLCNFASVNKQDELIENIKSKKISLSHNLRQRS